MDEFMEEDFNEVISIKLRYLINIIISFLIHLINTTKLCPLVSKSLGVNQWKAYQQEERNWYFVRW